MAKEVSDRVKNSLPSLQRVLCGNLNKLKHYGILFLEVSIGAIMMSVDEETIAFIRWSTKEVHQLLWVILILLMIIQKIFSLKHTNRVFG
jgi:hypothetical protein